MAKTYSSKRVVITYKGVRLTGYADGDFCTVNRTTDSFMAYVGADGEVARSATADKSGEIVITLSQTSASNDYLSAQLKLDELSLLGSGTLQIADTNGTTIVIASDCWLKKAADVTFGKEVSTRQWTFSAGNLDMTVGGNL